MTDNHAERCARLASAYSPEDWPLDPDPPSPQPDHGRTERRLAIVFAALAVLAISFGIGMALP